MLDTQNRDIQIFPDSEALAARAVDLIVQSAREAVAARGRFSFVLTGGSSPHETYTRLARLPAGRIDWAKTWIFLGDERFVSIHDENSNAGMCRRLLIEHIPVPAAQVCLIPTDLSSPEAAAEAYVQRLADAFDLPPNGPPPVFDTVLLGLGGDGHCASLFPGMPTLHEKTRWAVWSPPGTLPPPLDRVTLTFSALNAARQVLFFALSAGKADVVQDILEGGASPEVHPAAGVQPENGAVTWLLDAPAAARLGQS